MRLTTIWTLPGATLREKRRRTNEWVAQKVAAHLPKKVRYWTFIQVGAGAMGNDVVPEARFMTLLERVPEG